MQSPHQRPVCKRQLLQEKRDPSPDPGNASASNSPRDSSFSGRTTIDRSQVSKVHLTNPPTTIHQGPTHICPGTAQVYNLGAPIAVLLEAGALEAVEGVRDSLAAADDALVLVVAEGALVTDADERRGADVRVADGALAVALVADAADGDAGLLAAHDEVAGGVLASAMGTPALGGSLEMGA